MQVTFFQRKNRPNGNFSIESVFEEIRRQLANDIDSRVRIAPFLSNGILRRLAILVDVRRHQGQVNHITGDINFAGLLLDPRRTILTSHDCSYLTRTTGLRRWLLKLLWLDIPVRRARFITTVSEAAKRDLLSHTRCDPEKVVVIHNPIAPEFVRRPKQFNAVHPRILQIGTALNKNVPRLVQALEGIECTLVIIGDLDDEVRGLLKECQISYENYDQVAFSEIIRQYEIADVVVLPSTIEGFGLPILEANAIGRPVVTSNISSMPEVANDAACLVDPFSVQSIRAGIQRVLGDEAYRDDLIHKGFCNVRRYSPRVIAEKYLSLYRHIEQEMRQSNRMPKEATGASDHISGQESAIH